MVTDLGFAKRARAFAEALGAPLAIIEKRRQGNLDKAELMNVIGEVRGRRAVIVDDEIDTASTLIEIVNALEREGVDEIYACATHGVLSDPAVDRIRASRLREVVVTDTIPLPPAKRLPKIKTLSIAPLIGEAIKRIHRGESVGALFSSEQSFTQNLMFWDEEASRRTEESPGDPEEPPPRAILAGSAVERGNSCPSSTIGRIGLAPAWSPKMSSSATIDRSCVRLAGAPHCPAAGCHGWATPR